MENNKEIKDTKELKKNFEELSEEKKIKVIKQFNSLSKDSQGEIESWLYENYVDEGDICRNALDYFWFLNSDWVDRFNSTVNDNISDDFNEWLEDYDWENWNESLETFKKEFAEFVEQRVAFNLCYELKESIEGVENQVS